MRTGTAPTKPSGGEGRRGGEVVRMSGAGEGRARTVVVARGEGRGTRASYGEQRHLGRSRDTTAALTAAAVVAVTMTTTGRAHKSSGNPAAAIRERANCRGNPTSASPVCNPSAAFLPTLHDVCTRS